MRQHVAEMASDTDLVDFRWIFEAENALKSIKIRFQMLLFFRFRFRSKFK